CLFLGLTMVGEESHEWRRCAWLVQGFWRQQYSSGLRWHLDEARGQQLKPAGYSATIHGRECLELDSAKPQRRRSRHQETRRHSHESWLWSRSEPAGHGHRSRGDLRERIDSEAQYRSRRRLVHSRHFDDSSNEIRNELARQLVQLN